MARSAAKSTHEHFPVGVGKEDGRRSRRAVVGLLLGPALMVATLVAPLPLTREQHYLAGVLAFALTYWISEALPIAVTSLLVLALCVVFDIPPRGPDSILAPGEIVFAAFFSPTLFLLIGGLLIAQSMVKYQLSRRIALRVLAVPGIARSTYGTVLVLGALGAAMASVVDNGAVAAMLLPVAVGLNDALAPRIRARLPEDQRGRGLRFTAALMLMTAYGPTVGALITPVGDASNLIGRNFIEAEVGIRISFGQWILIATPIVVLLMAVLSVVVLGFNKPEVKQIPGAGRLVRSEHRRLGSPSWGEKNTLIAFGAAISLWLLPPIVGLIAGRGSSAHQLVIDRMPPEVAAIFAAGLLFILPVDWRRRTFTMSWEDAMKIDWGTVLLMGTGLMLGNLMARTGLAQLIGEFLTARGGDNTFVVYLLIAAAAILMSEMTSNLSSIGIILPIIPAVIAAGSGDIVTAGLIATFATKYGFMLPISTSANAIVYASGQLPITKMVRTGLFVDVSAVVVIVVGVSVMTNFVSVT